MCDPLQENDAWDTMLILCCIILLILMIIGSILCYQRRDMYPFKGRYIPPLIGTNFFMFLLIIDAILVNRPLGLTIPFPCGLHAIFVATSFIGIGVTYTIRAWLLLFRCKVHEAYVHQRKNERPAEEVKLVDQNWYTTNVHRMRPKFLVQVASMDYIVGILSTMIGFWTLDRDPHGAILDGNWDDIKNKDCPGCPSGAKVWGFIIFFIVLHCLLLVYLAFKLRSVYADGLMIRKEFMVTGVGMVIIGFLYGVLTLIFNAVDVGFGMGPFLGALGVALLLGGSTFMPLYYSYVAERQKDEDDRIIEGLREVIQKKQQRDALLEFLKSEFSTENLFFYEDAGTLISEIDTISLMDLRNKSTDIFYNFVEDEADQQINIPSGIRANIKIKCNAADTWTEGDRDEVAQLFKEAQKEVFKLMEKDSFVRWQRSKYAEPFSTRSPSATNKKGRKSQKLMADVPLDQSVDLRGMK